MDYNHLQLREIFHLQFLRWLGKKVNSSHYALKGGANLRFFYNSSRYSEDMDLDARVIRINALRDKVMQILQSPSFQNDLQPFGIKEIVFPDVTKAKQTETTQRFKVHLITFNEEDLFTKIEFSRRNFNDNVKTETVSSDILREYKLAPLLVPHYDANSAIFQKVEALAKRAATQARDIFDIYILIPQAEPSGKKNLKLNGKTAEKALENIYNISFEEFRNTVVFYLLEEDRKIYSSVSAWDEIRLKTANYIEQLK